MSEMRIYTPESVDLQLEVAGLGSRCIAYALDLLVQVALTSAIAWAVIATEAYRALELTDFGHASIWVLTLVFLLLAVIWLGLPLLQEVLWRGQTLGKRAVGLRVVAHSGLPAALAALAVRNLVRPFDALPGLFTLGALAIWLSPRRQRLGDLAAGTVVIRERKLGLEQAVPAPKRPPTVDVASLSPLTVQLPPELLDAMRTFMHKRAKLARFRRVELADRLALQVAQRGGWQGPVYNAELFLEDVLAVRSGQWQPGQPETAAVVPPAIYWRPIALPGGEAYRPPAPAPASPAVHPGTGQPSAR